MAYVSMFRFGPLDPIRPDSVVAPPSPQFTMTASLRNSRTSSLQSQNVSPPYRYAHATTNPIRYTASYQGMNRLQPYSSAINSNLDIGDNTNFSTVEAQSVDLPQCTQSPIKSGGSSSFSSAPDLYAVCETSKHGTVFTFPNNSTTITANAIPSEQPNSNEVKPDSSLDDYSTSGHEFDDTSQDFDEELKTSMTSDSSFSVPTTQSELPRKSPPSSNTELRRRMSMQSSLNQLQELIKRHKKSGPGKRLSLGQTDLGINTVAHRKTSISSSASIAASGSEYGKTSKAAVLREIATVIETQRSENFTLSSTIKGLRAEIESLQTSIK